LMMMMESAWMLKVDVVCLLKQDSARPGLTLTKLVTACCACSSWALPPLWATPLQFVDRIALLSVLLSDNFYFTTTFSFTAIQRVDHFEFLNHCK
jgi:hypothetical protein